MSTINKFANALGGAYLVSAAVITPVIIYNVIKIFLKKEEYKCSKIISSKGKEDLTPEDYRKYKKCFINIYKAAISKINSNMDKCNKSKDPAHCKFELNKKIEVFQKKINELEAKIK